MEDQLKQTQADIKELQKLVTDLRLQVATKSGAHAATAWWAVGVAALVAAWLGVTSIWHIPVLVRATGAGEAQQAAEAAARQAKADASAIAEIKKTMPNAVSYGERITIRLGRDLTTGLLDNSDPFVAKFVVPGDPSDAHQQWVIDHAKPK